MFKAEWSLGKSDFAKIEALRREIYVNGRGIAKAEEFDALDAYAGHVYVCEDTGAPIAAGRIWPRGDALIIDRIAVLPAYDTQPYAELVLRLLLFKAQELPQSSIHFIAEAERFALAERFGFKQIAPAQSTRGGMSAEFACPSAAIIWDSACKH